MAGINFNECVLMIQVVDATLPIEEIHKQIRDASLKVISEVNNKPIEKLWTDRN